MFSRVLTLLVAIAMPAFAQAPTPAASSPAPAPDAAPTTPTPAPLTTPVTVPAAVTEPIAGISDGTLFLRSPDNLFQAFPGGRLQLDGYFYNHSTDKLPNNTFLVRRARLELFGWMGPWVGFNIAGDFAAGPTASANPLAPSAQNATDAYILLAPWKDLAILQVGQFDAPFTLENRTSDKYSDLMERSSTVRTFAIPSNKELGAMLHGLVLSKMLYYSFGVFNGDGQNFKNADNTFDVMGRAFVAPFALLKDSPIENVTLGGSVWLGHRGAKGLALGAQQTLGGFRYFGDKWTSSLDSTIPLELHQHGGIQAFAIELNAPITHRFALRFEAVNKRQELGEDDVSKTASGTLSTLGHATLEGWSMYLQASVWLIGDDTIVGRPGLQLPQRFSKFGAKTPQHGLQLVARVERLDERLTSDRPGLGNPNQGRTMMLSLQVGATYWFSKRFRAMFNYSLNDFEGDSAVVKKAWANLGGSHMEHEFLFRLGVAL